MEEQQIKKASATDSLISALGELIAEQHEDLLDTKEQVSKVNYYEEDDTPEMSNGDVNGCLRHKKDIMLTYKIEGKDTMYDLFLDKDQANSLCKELVRHVNGLMQE